MFENNETTNAITEEMRGQLLAGWGDSSESYNQSDFVAADGRQGNVLENEAGEGVSAVTEDPTGTPTTGDGEGTEDNGVVSPDGSNTEEVAPDAAQTEPVKEPEKRTYKLKVNHKEREVSLTDEEALRRIQMSYALEDKENRAKFREISERLEEEFRTASEQTIRMLAKQEMGGYEPPAEDEDGAEPQQDTEKQNLLDEIASLRGQLAAEKSAAEKARKEAAIQKQNADNARRAPVKGTTGGGQEQPKTDSRTELLLKGFRDGGPIF